jgi:hypothetical protein
VDAVTAHLRAVASRVVAAALRLGPLEAALLTGSGARGDGDLYSDVDLLLYVKALPPEARLDELRRAVEGENPIRLGDRSDGEDSTQFEVGGISTQVSFVTVAGHEELLDQLLDRLENVHSPHQKVLSGLLEGIPLHGEELIGRWQERVHTYPDGLRRAVVAHHWRFFPLWWYQDALAARDAELWRIELLLEAAFDLLGVLSGLNRVYYTPFQLKRLRALTASFALAPVLLADRLESLPRLASGAAADELGRLVEETRELVLGELPDADLPLRRPPGARIQPWELPGESRG